MQTSAEKPKSEPVQAAFFCPLEPLSPFSFSRINSFFCCLWSRYPSSFADFQCLLLSRIQTKSTFFFIKMDLHVYKFSCIFFSYQSSSIPIGSVKYNLSSFSSTWVSCEMIFLFWFPAKKMNDWYLFCTVRVWNMHAKKSHRICYQKEVFLMIV